VCTREHFWNPSSAKLVIAYPNYWNLTENSACNLLKFTWKFWNCEAPSFTDFLSTLSVRSSLTTDGWTLRSSSWTFVYPSLNTLCHCLIVPLYIKFGHKLHIIHYEFPQHWSFWPEESGWYHIFHSWWEYQS
jgi:hypothetical protein